MDRIVTIKLSSTPVNTVFKEYKSLPEKFDFSRAGPDSFKYNWSQKKKDADSPLATSQYKLRQKKRRRSCSLTITRMVTRSQSDTTKDKVEIVSHNTEGTSSGEETGENTKAISDEKIPYMQKTDIVQQ